MTTHTKRADGNIRDRARQTAADAFHGKGLTFRHLNQVVNDVLSEIADEVRSAIPDDRRNKLRQVFDGLGDAVASAASAGQKAFRDTREHAAKLATEHAPAAARRISEANDQFLDAVSGFASRASGELRTELDDLVRSARRAGPRITEGVQSAARAASQSSVGALAADTARSGARLAQRAAHDIAQVAGGLLEGLADAIGTPARKPARRTGSKPVARTKPAPARRTAKKVSKTAPRKKAASRARPGRNKRRSR